MIQKEPYEDLLGFWDWK